MIVGERRAAAAEIPTASMADIAFLLLIFFLVTTTIDSDKGIALTLPAMGEDFQVKSQMITNILINARVTWSPHFCFLLCSESIPQSVF